MGRDEPDAGSPLPGPSQPGRSQQDATSSPPHPGINGPTGQQFKRNPVFPSLLCPHCRLVASNACVCLLLCHRLCHSLETSTTAGCYWKHRKARVHGVHHLHHVPLPFLQRGRVQSGVQSCPSLQRGGKGSGNGMQARMSLGLRGVFSCL